MKTRRVAHKKVKKAYSKKAIAKKDLLSIPELRRAFESVEAMARRRPSNQQFIKHWERVFGHKISEKSAKEYLAFMGSRAKGSSKKQRGGMAPLDYQLRPGHFGTPDGAYQEYVSKGFFVPEMNRLGECAGTPLKGGKRRSRRSLRSLRGGVMASPADAAAAFVSHPYSGQNPPTYAHLATKDFYGQPFSMASDVTRSPPNYLPTSGNMIGPIGVTPLSNDINNLMARPA